MINNLYYGYDDYDVWSTDGLIPKIKPNFFGALINAKFGELNSLNNISSHIKNVIFNPPATIIIWKDGSKTVVKAENEDFDSEKGFAMAICKWVSGNKGNYYEMFKKWLPKDVKSDD